MKQRPRVRYGNDDYGYDYHAKYSDDSGDEIDLAVRNNHKTEQYVEADILDGDTLQAIALRFNCSVESLKKANNIHKENEIHARKRLKIPIKAFSLLTENFPLVHTSGSNSPTKMKEVVIEDNYKADPLNGDLQEKLIIASVNSAEVQHPTADTIPGDIPSTSGQRSAVYADETVPLIMDSESSNPSTECIVVKEFTSRGDDFGIKWFHLLGFALLLCVIIPFIYVLNIAEHPEKYLHHTNVSTSSKDVVKSV